MWFIFGIFAIAATFVNLARAVTGKAHQGWMAAALALTAFTVCGMYTEAYGWVKAEDVSAILDVMPTMSWMIWVLTGISVLLNGLSVPVGKRTTGQR